MALTVTPVWSKSDRAEFIKFPYRLHGQNPAFVPPLLSEAKDVIDIKKNPFFMHAEMEMFLARLNGKVVGRIAAIIDQNYIDASHQLCGLFGSWNS